MIDLAPGASADGLWDFYLGSVYKYSEYVDGDYVTTAGDFFGELALLDAGPRNATVTAEDDVKVLVDPRPAA